MFTVTHLRHSVSFEHSQPWLRHAAMPRVWSVRVDWNHRCHADPSPYWSLIAMLRHIQVCVFWTPQLLLLLCMTVGTRSSGELIIASAVTGVLADLRCLLTWGLYLNEAHNDVIRHQCTSIHSFLCLHMADCLSWGQGSILPNDIAWQSN